MVSVVSEAGTQEEVLREEEEIPSVCDEQLMSIGGRLRCQETRRPTSVAEVATPYARDFDPSLALQIPTTTNFAGSMTPSGSTTVHRPHIPLNFLNPSYASFAILHSSTRSWSLQFLNPSTCS